MRGGSLQVGVVEGSPTPPRRGLWRQGSAAWLLGAVLTFIAGTSAVGQAAAPQEPTAAVTEGSPDDATATATAPTAGSDAIRVSVEPTQATVGQRIQMTIAVDLPERARFIAPTLGPQLGKFSVSRGAWQAPSGADSTTWTWVGEIAAFETGELEVPAIRFDIEGPDGALRWSTEPVALEIVSVLDPAELEQEQVEISDLKPPVSIPADFRALWAGLAILAVMAAVAGAIWWLQRRYAAKLSSVSTPEDVFQRIPPHVWVYGELQRLLEQRLPEQGQIEPFYRELARILKRYLGGRYRVELMEQTSEDVPILLRQAGAPERPIQDTRNLLTASDLVKFAKELPGAQDWKASVEQVYRIVDATKPVDADDTNPEQGAA